MSQFKEIDQVNNSRHTGKPHPARCYKNDRRWGHGVLDG